MKTSDFAYDLPEELIAQDPLSDRASSRLMILDKQTGEITHRIFRDRILKTGGLSRVKRHEGDSGEIDRRT